VLDRLPPPAAPHARRPHGRGPRWTRARLAARRHQLPRAQPWCGTRSIAWTGPTHGPALVASLGRMGSRIDERIAELQRLKLSLVECIRLRLPLARALQSSPIPAAGLRGLARGRATGWGTARGPRPWQQGVDGNQPNANASAAKLQAGDRPGVLV